jgi:hypothetical protein
MVIYDVPATPGTISGPASACTNSSGNEYSISPVQYATGYNWGIPADAVITQNTGTSITVTFGMLSGDITVSATGACGTGGTSTKAVSLLAQPASTFTSSAPLWTNYAISFSPTVASGVTYSWSFPGGSPSGSTIQNPSASWASPRIRTGQPDHHVHRIRMLFEHYQHTCRCESHGCHVHHPGNLYMDSSRWSQCRSGTRSRRRRRRRRSLYRRRRRCRRCCVLR